MVAFRKALWNFPRPDHDSKEFRGFPGMELGIFRVAKSAGEGRDLALSGGRSLLKTPWLPCILNLTPALADGLA